MITAYHVAVATFFLVLGWFGGRAWMKLIFPDIRESLVLLYLPLIITGAILSIILLILDRVGVPITFWSVVTVISLNTIIPGIFIVQPLHRIRKR